MVVGDEKLTTQDFDITYMLRGRRQRIQTFTPLWWSICTLGISIGFAAVWAFYWAAWIIDGEVAKTFTTWYTPAQFKFGFSIMTFADGGGWQGDKPTAKTYTAKYDYIEYKKYNYDEE